jgi:hypothetical protein
MPASDPQPFTAEYLNQLQAELLMTDQTMSAKWQVVEDPQAAHLHIALWNGRSLTVTVWKDDAATPFVTLRTADHGEHDLTECDFAGFKRWLEGAQGKPARQRARQVAK